MVECSRCRLWVHAACDSMSQADYAGLCQSFNAVEYFCPRCRKHKMGAFVASPSSRPSLSTLLWERVELCHQT